MAFIASKYTGGIMVNNPDIVAPLFAGAGVQTKLPDIPELNFNAGQLQGTQLRRNIIEKEQMIGYLKTLAENGDMNAYNSVLQLQQEVQKDMAMIPVVERNYNTVEEAQKHPNATKPYIGSKGVSGSVVSMIANGDRNLIDNTFSFGESAWQDLNTTGLTDEYGVVRSIYQEAALNSESIGIMQYISDAMKEIDGSYSYQSGFDDYGIARDLNKSEYTTKEDYFSSNYINLVSTIKAKIDGILTNPSLQQELQSDALRSLQASATYDDKGFHFNLDLPKMKYLSGKDNEINHILMGKKNGKDIYIQEKYIYNVTNPSYSIIENKNGYWIPGEDITMSVNDYKPAYIYEKVFDNADQENFLGMYLNGDQIFNYSLLGKDGDYENGVATLHKVMSNAFPSYSQQNKLRNKDEFETEEEYIEYSKTIFKQADDYAKSLINSYARRFAERLFEKSTTGYVKSNLRTTTATKPFEATESSLYDTLAFEFDQSGQAMDVIYMNTSEETPNMYNGPLFSSNISEPTLKTIWGEDFYKSIAGYNAKTGGVSSAKYGTIYLNENAPNASIYNHFNAQTAFTLASDGRFTFAIPIAGNNITGDIKQIPRKAYSALKSDNGSWYLNENMSAPINLKDLNEDEMAAAGKEHKVAVVAVPFSQVKNMKFTMNSENLIRQEKQNDREFKITVEDRIFSESLSSYYDKEQFKRAYNRYSKAKEVEGKTLKEILFSVWGENQEQISTHRLDWIYREADEQKNKYDKLQDKNGLSFEEYLFNQYTEVIDTSILNNYKDRLKKGVNSEGKEDIFITMTLKEVYGDDKAIIKALGYSEDNPNGWDIVRLGRNEGSKDRTDVMKQTTRAREDTYVLFELIDELPMYTLTEGKTDKQKSIFSNNMKKYRRESTTKSATKYTF